MSSFRQREMKPSLRYSVPIILFVLLGFSYLGYQIWTKWFKATVLGEGTQGVITECYSNGGYELIRYKYSVITLENIKKELNGEILALHGCQKYYKGNIALLHYYPPEPTMSYLDGITPLQEQWGWLSIFGVSVSVTMLFLVLFGIVRFAKTRFWIIGNKSAEEMKK
jgi:hypothetical protein